MHICGNGIYRSNGNETVCIGSNGIYRSNGNETVHIGSNGIYRSKRKETVNFNGNRIIHIYGNGKHIGNTIYTNNDEIYYSDDSSFEENMSIENNPYINRYYYVNGRKIKMNDNGRQGYYTSNRIEYNVNEIGDNATNRIEYNVNDNGDNATNRIEYNVNEIGDNASNRYPKVYEIDEAHNDYNYDTFDINKNNQEPNANPLFTILSWMLTILLVVLCIIVDS